ncbi:o-succinylbenzoate--CoA ligase [Georgenia alba]|uniref:O-succinylbenzoate--CoA ligase n=1 Tax=Georgenia alba TaxID=2233858 RepID=A0ABW2QC12_9MICO
MSTGPGVGRPFAPSLLPLRGGTRPDDVAALRAAVHGTLLEGRRDAVLLPHGPDLDGGRAVRTTTSRLRGPLPAGTVVVLQTSGSTTGTGHLVALTAESLVAGARATEERLQGPGRWVLAVPAHHVAGFQLLVRSVVAGTDPVVVDTGAGFEPAALAAAVSEMDDAVPGYLSLVPTQLVRVLQAGEGAIAPLRRLSAVLVGGAASSPRMLADARAAGLRVRTTYGMTETGGGCVYDGRPLPGVRLRLGEAGRVEIAGPVLAAGYLDDPASDAFVVDDGVRWLRTRDRGALEEEHGELRLRVLGRIDEVITTGGVKVSPGPVEQVLASHPGVAEACVVGVPDPEWGELLTAVVVPTGPTVPALATLRDLVGRELGGPAAPRALVVVDALPLRGPGKTDRHGVARHAADALTGSVTVRGVERHGRTVSGTGRPTGIS